MSTSYLPSERSDSNFEVQVVPSERSETYYENIKPPDGAQRRQQKDCRAPNRALGEEV
jgi:hypothetical protein